MSPRKPIHGGYDAVVDFFPPATMPEFVYGLVKFTYDIVDGRCRRGAVEPLFHDVRAPDVTPRWAPGSDFWPNKLETDVAVRGQAYAPRGRPVTSHRVRVVVGERARAIQVFGDRSVAWTGRGALRFGAPAPFVTMPIAWTHAYGGWDPRTPVEPPKTIADHGRLQFDHPGMYPRNPFGRGYVVIDEPCEGIVLPNLEDPRQLLKPETLVTGDPRLWYRQPLPACFDFTSAYMFHRLCWLGAEAWYHPPPGAPLAEVEHGLLPVDYHALSGSVNTAPQALQEGAMGLVFPSIAARTPIAVEGMHPEHPRIQFELPAPPKLGWKIEGSFYVGWPQLNNVLIEPDKLRVSLTYVARHAELPRVFVPGIHAKIPVELHIDGEAKVVYDCPATLRDLRRAGPK
ncbi:DUF2169 domain-containing protein [Nannocystis sp. ILAH1]|uniref:DUF2169 domain-containing protein n=1 Tax=Nannocystis sp. ILAH1 TaxID=2996789 RepID=UPI002270FFCB|nr:DUF2169 domain-containing protein [Nannocystis sp. ILAH1]MCY0987545.1 DUF2169 domain-containing protein [Nannocystis sp. ILAH1]